MHGTAHYCDALVLEPVDSGPNVVLRDDPDRGSIVVIAFPYDAQIVEAVRRIPGRRFDWDAYEWWAPVGDWAGAHVSELLEHYPELESTDDVQSWLTEIRKRWIGTVDAEPHDGRGWFACRTRAGMLPEVLAAQAISRGDAQFLPLEDAVADVLQDLPGARLSGGAVRCAIALAMGRDPARATIAVEQSVTGDRLRLDVNWDPEVLPAFLALPEADSRTRSLPIDPWHAEHLDEFCARHGVEVSLGARRYVEQMREDAEAARAAVRRSKATSAPPIEGLGERLGGTLEPFQWAGVRDMLTLRRRVPRRRAGARQDDPGARGDRGRRRLPRCRRLPGVAEAQLAARGRSAGCPPRAASRSSAGAAARCPSPTS